MQSLIRSLLFLAASASIVSAHPHLDSHHFERRALPTRWYQRDDAPAHALFKRAPGDPQPGSPEWYNLFPQPNTIDSTPLPQAWKDALDAAVKAGKIPDAPVSTSDGGNPTYGTRDPSSKDICSATYKECRVDGDIWDAPDGVFSSSFDDGPTPDSTVLYEFLQANDAITTHFMIGINIINNYNEFMMAFDQLKSDIAVHTWSHRYTTTLTNEQVLGELAWTMQAIYTATGGRLPKYWRPPYGDSDIRTSAIAREVLGLTTCIWNQDTEDWSIGQKDGATREEVDADLKKWIEGPKSPGLVILEHELNNNTIGAFMQAFPLIKQNGWNFVSMARQDGGSVYQNAQDSVGPVTPGEIGVVDDSDSDSDSSSSSSSSSTKSGSSTTSGSSSAPTAPTGNNAGINTTSSSSGTSPTSGASGDGNGAPSLHASSGALVSFAAMVVAAVAFS